MIDCNMLQERTNEYEAVGAEGNNSGQTSLGSVNILRGDHGEGSNLHTIQTDPVRGDLQHHPKVLLSEIKALSDFLKCNYPKCIPIACKARDKAPVYAHKELSDKDLWNKWYDEGMNMVVSGGNMSLVIREGLIVIDCDAIERAQDFENRFDDFTKTVSCNTKKGRHFYFTPTDQCKDWTTQTRVVGDADIIYRHRSGTGALINVPPSTNKTWLRSILDTKVLPMPDEFAGYINQQRKQLTPLRVLQDGTEEEISSNNNSPNKNKIDGELLKKIVCGLSDDRAKSYDNWLRICFAIMNIGRDNGYVRKARNLVHTFSNRCADKYDEDEVERFLDNMGFREDGLGLGYVLDCLKHDNWVCFKKVIKKLHPTTTSDLAIVGYSFIDDKQDQIETLIADMFTEGLSHDKVANLFVMYQDKLVYAGDDTFYEKNEYGMYVMVEAATQKPYIEKMVKDAVIPPIKEYYPIIQSAIRQKYNDGDEQLKKALNAFNTNFNKMKTSLETVGFISGVVETLKQKYMVVKLYDKLDEDRMLVGFPNGVLDLRTMELRNASNDEHVSLCMGVELEKQYNDITREDFADATAFMNDILYADDAEWFIKYCSSLLEGGNLFQFILNLIGSGANGKSAIMTAIVDTFGSYNINITQQMYRDAQQTAEKPDPSKLAKKGKRLAYMNETSETLIVNSSTFKNEAEDHIETGRDLYSKTIRTFKTQYATVISSNNALKFNDGADFATFRRIKALRFPYQFRDESKYDANNPLHKRLVPTAQITAKLKKLQKQLCMMLVYYYPVFKEEGLTDAVNIKNETKNYIKQVDDLAGFIEDNIEQETDGKAWIDDLYAAYGYYLEDDKGRLGKREFIKKVRKLQYVVEKEKTRCDGRKDQSYIMGYRNVSSNDADYAIKDDYN